MRSKTTFMRNKVANLFSMQVKRFPLNLVQKMENLCVSWQLMHRALSVARAISQNGSVRHIKLKKIISH